jgi:hypothetical protein
MSVPIQSSTTSPVIGQVNFGWISEAWRFFSAQMGVWILAVLIFSAPTVIFMIVFYALMWSTMFPGGFPPTAQTVPGTAPVPAANPALLGSHMTGIFAMEIGFGLVYSLWAAYLYGGLFRMAVQQVRGLPIELRDIFRGGPLFGRMLGAIFLLGFGAYGLEAVCMAPFGLTLWQHGPVAAMVGTGILAFVLVIGLMLVFSGMLLPSFALMADGDGVLTALKRSLRAMKSQWPAAAGFVFVLIVLVYASEIPCGLGLLATIPMFFLITALAYRDMIGMPNMAPLPAPFYAQAAAGVWPPPPTAAPQDPNRPTERYEYEKETDA